MSADRGENTPRAPRSTYSRDARKEPQSAPNARNAISENTTADCAEHVLPLFSAVRPADDRPRRAIDLGRAWARGEVRMTEARKAAGHANGATAHRDDDLALPGVVAGPGWKISLGNIASIDSA